MARREEVEVFLGLDVHADPRTPAEPARDVRQFRKVAVVEKTADAGLVIRIDDQVLDRREPMGLTPRSAVGLLDRPILVQGWIGLCARVCWRCCSAGLVPPLPSGSW